MSRPYVRLPILFGTITAMILLMAAITLFFVERRILALSGEALSLAAADIADKLDLVLYERAGDIQAMAKVNSSLLATREFKTLSNNLTAIQQAYPIYLWLGVTDQNGRVVAATDGTSVGEDRSQRIWFQRVHAQKDIYVEEPRFSEDAGGVSTIAFSAPIVGLHGEFLGVVTSRVGLAALDNLFARTVHLIEGEHRLTGSVEWELLARDGSVLSDSGQGGTMVNLLNLAVSSAKLSLDPATRPGYVAEQHDRRQVPVITGYAHTNGYGRFVSPFLGVLVRKDRSDILSPIPTTIWQLGAAGTVVILPLWGLLFWTTRRLGRAYDDLEMRVQERTTELSQSNAILLAQQNITLDGILIVDQQGQILSFNQQFMDLWSIPREVMESRSDERAIQCVLGKLQHPEEFVARVQYLYAHPAETLRDEIALCDGRTFDRYSASMKGSDGTYNGRIWYFRDITGRKRLEEKQAHLAAIIDATPDFVAMADPDGHALYMNRAGRALIGVEEEADISRLRIADKDQPLWPADYLQKGLATAAREGRWSGETDMLTRDGRTIPMSQVVLAHKGSDGSVAFFSTIARDITERHQAEAALRESEQRFRHIVETIPDCIFINNAQADQIIYMNPTGLRLLGATRSEQVIGQSILRFIHPDFQAIVKNRIDLTHRLHSPAPQIEEKFLRVDGTAIDVEVTASPVSYQGGQMVFVVAHNITERKQAQHKLEEQLRLKAFTAEVEAALARSTKIQEGLRTCAKSMVQYLGAAFARIWTLDPDQNVLCLQVSEGIYTNLEGSHARVPVGQYKIGLIAQEQQPHLTNQVIGDPRVHDQEWAKREGMVAFAGYPLVVEGCLLGVMAMFARQALSEDVLQALQTVAYGIAQFIERKREEATVRTSEAWFRSLIEHAADLILVFDADGTIQYASPSHRALGYASADLIGKTIFSFMHPDDLPKASETLTHALQSPGTPRSVEVRIRTADGQWRIMDSIGQAVAAPSGKLQMVINARDITDRKQAEAEKVRLAAIQEATTDFVSFADRHGDVAYINRAGRKLIGLAEDTDLSGMTIPDFYPKGAWPLIKNAGLPTAVDKGFWTGETVLLTRDGREIPVSQVILAHKSADGAVEFFSTIVRDITERKQKEEELVRSRETLRRIIDNIPQHVFWKDLNLNYLGCNAAFAQSAGVGVPAAIIGKTDFELSWGDKAEMYRADDRSVIESMTPKLNFEEPLPRPDGSVWIIRTNKVPLVDQEGTVFGILGMFEDITERYRAEEQIRLVTSALEAAANGVVITDTEGTIQWVNPAFTVLTGYCAEDVIGQNPRILKSNLQDQRFYQQLWDTITAGKSWYGEVVNKRKDGTLYTEEMSISPVRDLKGAINHFVAIKVDISQRKQMEAIAVRLERQAAFGQLLGGIAHELKNPLFILTGHLQLLKTKLGQVKHAAAADLRKLEEVTRRITLITQRFLDLATPITMRQARCSIPGLLQSALDLLHNALSQGHVRVLTTWAPDLPDTWSDPGQVREVFLNLFLNAIQAMTAAHGRGTLTITAALVADVGHVEREGTASLPSPPLLVSDAERGWIEVTIQDDGPGIPPELRTKIFEPFFTTKPPENVTGLGLWIVRSNLMMLCGTIRVDSEVGHGTTFIVRLPVVAEPSTSVDPPAPGAGRG